MLAFWDDENFHSLVATAAVGLLVLVIFLGVPYSILWCIRWFLKWVFKGPATSTRGSQTEERPADHDGGPEAKAKGRAYEKFAEEYVDRCTELRQVLHERCREVAQRSEG